MICEQCGAQIPEDTYFCPECGTKREDLPEKEISEEIPPKRNKTVVLIGIALVGLLVVISIIGISIRVAEAKAPDIINYDTFVSNTEGEFFWNTEGGRYSTNAEAVQYNGDHSLAVYSVYEGDSLTLYYLDKALEPKRVAENIYSFAFSYTGEYIGYVKAEDGTGSGELCLYHLEKDKTTVVDTNVYPEYFCLSPSGKAVSYIKDYEDEDNFVMYVGGAGIKSKEVSDDNCAPVALTDNAKTLYYINDDYKLYVYDGKDSEKLASGVGTSFIANREVSELLFSEDGETYYYTRKMEEPLKIAGAVIEDIAQNEDVANTLTMNGYSKILGVHSLKGLVLETGDGLYWFNKEGTDAVKICSNIYSTEYRISENGKSAICVMNGGLYQFKKLSDNMEGKLLYDEEIIEGVFSNADLSRIYLMIDGELHYLKGKNKTVELTDDLEVVACAVAYNEGAKKIYFIEDDTLYSATTKKKSVEAVSGENVVGVVPFFEGVVYFTEQEGKSGCYYIDGDGNVEELYTYEGSLEE